MATEEANTKQCRKCGEAKQRTAFGPRHGGRDGLRATCKACRARYIKAWYEANPEKRREYAHQFTSAHPEAVAAKTKRYRQRHPERFRLRQAKWYAENAGWRRDKTRIWREKNPDMNAAQRSARRARVLAAPVGDRKSVIAVKAWARSAASISCYWCGKATPRGRRHVDHIIPLARGGADAAGNLCVSCPGCNQRKHAKLPENFTGQSELRLA